MVAPIIRPDVVDVFLNSAAFMHLAGAVLVELRDLSGGRPQLLRGT